MTGNSFTDAMHFLRSYLSGRPSYLIYFVTAACNARCRHCFYWKEISSADTSRELSLDEIGKLAASMELIYLSMGGGEPFMREDIADIVRIFRENSGILYCNIVTNGFHTRRIVADTVTVLQQNPRLRLKIQVSIDDFQEAHDEYRRVSGIWARAIETLEKLSEVREVNGRFSLDVATCITRSNRGHAIQLHDSIRSLADFDSYQFLYPRGNAESELEKEVALEDYRRAVEHASGFDSPQKHNPVIAAVNRIAGEGLYRYLGEGRYPWNCLAGRKFLSVTERGILQPCEVLAQKDPEEDSDMADLRDFDFDVGRALKTDRAQSILKRIRDTACSCSFECAANCNVVFTRREALRALGNLIFRRG